MDILLFLQGLYLRKRANYRVSVNGSLSPECFQSQHCPKPRKFKLQNSCLLKHLQTRRKYGFLNDPFLSQHCPKPKKFKLQSSCLLKNQQTQGKYDFLNDPFHQPLPRVLHFSTKLRLGFEQRLLLCRLSSWSSWSLFASVFNLICYYFISL